MNRFVTDTTLVYTSIFCGLDDCNNMFLASFPSFSVYHSNRIFIRFNYAFSNFSWLLLYLKLKSIVHMFFQIVHIWLPFFFSTRLTLSQLLWLICFLQRLQEYFCLIQGSLTPRTHWAATSVMHKVSLLSLHMLAVVLTCFLPTGPGRIDSWWTSRIDQEEACSFHLDSLRFLCPCREETPYDKYDYLSILYCKGILGSHVSLEIQAEDIWS